MDAWIDQSWSGAWEDVPSRHSTGLGWTHQLGYILAHRAQIEGGNAQRAGAAARPCAGCAARCKHYVVSAVASLCGFFRKLKVKTTQLHDTFDSYEGWDTLDNVPLKLAWVSATTFQAISLRCILPQR